MRSLALALSTLLMLVYANMEEVEILDDILVYPIPAHMKIEKRETTKDSPDKDFSAYLGEKLAQHTQALEHIVKKVDDHGNSIKQLIEYLSKNLEKPKLPEKVEPQKVKEQNERRSSNYDEEVENPILRLGKNLPKYGRLARDLFLGEIRSETDPTPLIERNPDSSSISESSRRSNGDSSEVETSQPNKEEINSWCEVAMLCEKSLSPVCGFDDNYGYGKFDDICHMLHVNCYYRYNFVLVHTCRPMI